MRTVRVEVWENVTVARPGVPPVQLDGRRAAAFNVDGETEDEIRAKAKAEAAKRFREHKFSVGSTESGHIVVNATKVVRK